MIDSRDLLELDLRPLPTSAAGERDVTEDELLGQALHEIYRAGETAPLNEGTWKALEAVAREEASRRRRTYLTRRLAATMGPRRMLAYAAALLVVIGAALVAGIEMKPSAPTSPPVLAELHTTVSSTATNGRKLTLLNGAVIDVRGEAAIDQSGPSGEQVQLHSGAVHAIVPKLVAGRSFVVTTPHAEVTVHGTRFTVEQSSVGDTIVSVEEGLVAVRPVDGHRPTLFVRPGESVTVKPFAAYFAELQAAVDHAKDGADCNDPQDLVAKYIEAAPPSADVSAAHFFLGVCARKRGETATAVDQFEQAAQTTTDRSRADNALADAAQLRSQRDHQDGVEAWNRYLKRFPNGLHTDLARSFLGESLEGSGGP